MKRQNDVAAKVIDYIETNLEKEIDLEHIAKNVGYSKFYLNRIFTECTGITIYKYLQSRRLTVAAEKLVKTGKPIMEIAYEAGYDTQQSFSYAFKQIYQYPPKSYREIGVFLPKQGRISVPLCTACVRPRGRYYRGSRRGMSSAYALKYYKFTTKIKEIAA